MVQLPLKPKPRINGPMQMKRKANKFVHYDDEDEEEDEQLDDFIDDSHLQKAQKNRIRSLYRYQDDYEEQTEDDLSNMEAGFDEIEHEEEMSKYIAR